VTISKVGVVGAGLMGSGIAQVAAQAGVPAVLVKARGGDLEPLREWVERCAIR
jgi:3-hydroxybutyryl-CoA dehydrogenase